jgi:hypothetical protein
MDPDPDPTPFFSDLRITKKTAQIHFIESGLGRPNETADP